MDQFYFFKLNAYHGNRIYQFIDDYHTLPYSYQVTLHQWANTNNYYKQESFQNFIQNTF